jgi:nitroreductase
VSTLSLRFDPSNYRKFAPSGGNMQRCRFVIVCDPQAMGTVGALYGVPGTKSPPWYQSSQPAPGTSQQQFDRMPAAAEPLAHDVHEAAVWIVPCLQGEAPTRTVGSSIYSAVQDMLLAARGLGLGATLRTLSSQAARGAHHYG